ncbi:asparaginase [Jeongeupia naejangsanensis]|uniref:Asparaginase n=2 Tax=Jeongeupia naejangsanensis TaxID=613195 RepID=A0ABS2BGD6_9NEIS|nr:asparaginase [Jeongeupia naejangsanensis]
MQPGPAGLAPVPGALTERLQQLAPDADLIEYTPLLDSSAMGPAHWNRIATDIIGRGYEYDGFLVLHGTDTLAWTASALSMLLRGLNKPVLLTGAMRPWFEPGSDAPGNVKAALALLGRPEGFAEVGVVMANQLWRGCRVRKLDCDDDDAFAAPNELPLGRFAAGGWEFALARFRLPAKGVSPDVLPVNDAARVLHVQLAPGFSVEWLADALRNAAPDALLLQSFGSGNVPAHPDLLSVLADLAVRIPVVNLSICPRGTARPGLYAAGVLADGAMLDGGQMTPEAALTKLYAVLREGHGVEARARAFVEDWCGEHGEADSTTGRAVV